jgi:23S rRNA (uracil1939-C5)-methyltransferase
MAKKNTDKAVFINKSWMLVQASLGSKGPGWKIVLAPNVVPGDVVDVRLKAKAYYEGKAVQFHEYSEHR